MPASPDSTCPLLPFTRSSEGSVRALVASSEREGEGTLRFLYILDADLSTVRVPPSRVPGRADELWKHTCFEAFIAHPSAGDPYIELNFSPSTEWAAYSFESYRKGMAPLALPCAPRIEVTRAASRLIVEACVSMPERVGTSDAKLRIALSAVIEDESGRLSYWALKHAPDKPDFHHAAGFILEV
jgi:hypothetical protein